MFFPDGLADDVPSGARAARALPSSPEVVARVDGQVRVVRRSMPAPVPAPDGEPVWRCSLRAAELLCRLLDLPVADDAQPADLRAVADAAIAAARPQCVPAGRSPQGSDVWALPRGVRRVGLVFARGAELPGQRTVVFALTPTKMEADYPAAGQGQTDWRVRHLRGLYALQALEALADEQGPDSDAARHLAAVQAATEEDMRAVLGDVP